MDESFKLRKEPLQDQKSKQGLILEHAEQDLSLDNDRVSLFDVKSKDSFVSEDRDIDQVIKLDDVGDVGELMGPDEPKYIGFDRKYAGFVSKSENHQIILIRRKLKSYYEINETNLRGKYLALKELDKACGDYTFLRFTMFRGKKAKRLKKEVTELRKEVNTRLKALKDQKNKKRKDLQRDHTNSKQAQKLYDKYVRLGNKTGFGLRFLGGVIGTVRFLVENPIRLALKAVTVPFWAVNEAARGLVKASGHRPQRHIKFPGLHSPFTYSDRTIRTLRRWFGNDGTSTNRYRSLHNNEGRGANWYDAFLTDYQNDKLNNKNLYEEEAQMALLERGIGLDDYADDEEREYVEEQERLTDFGREENGINEKNPDDEDGFDGE